MTSLAPPEASPNATPPHHPKYGINLSRETITDILSHCFPGLKDMSIAELEGEGSYNNRIYFCEVMHPRDDHHLVEQDFVLKVNGRFFGPRKVQNEVACLRLLQRHCPDIPLPRVVAWSDNGLTMTSLTSSDERTCVVDTSIARADKVPSHLGWLLMTKVLGEPVSNDYLNDASLSDLGMQLANTVASWRRDVPWMPFCGSMCFCQGDYRDKQPDMALAPTKPSESSKLVIRGILGEGINLRDPPSTSAAYYKAKLEVKLGQLQTVETYARNRSVVPDLQAFLEDHLHELTFHEASGASPERSRFVFTHYDLSPRNVIVSGKPPRITGIVDFEFSGFFPPLDEFLNDYVGNAEDWPKAAYDAYLEALEGHGVATPQKSIERHIWERSYCTEKLIENIAPWWLPGPHTGDDLDTALAEAEEVARTMMSKLTGSFKE